MSTVMILLLWGITVGMFVVLSVMDREHKENESFVFLLQKLEEYAAIAVRFAKDIGDEEGLSGEEKRTIAIAALLRFRDILKLDKEISVEQLEQLVRSAYTVMYNEDESATYIVGK